jgi:nucleoside phosphorylase
MFKDSRMALIISGIGKVNAAMACVWLIRSMEPYLICNIGAAGALDEKVKLGALYHINKVIEPDRPDLRTGVFMEHIPDVLEGFSLAALATQDRPLRLPGERKEIVGIADLVDMEGAAIVQTARRFGLGCFLFKFVSDTPAHDRRSTIIKNIERLRDVQLRFFEHLVLPALPNAGSTNR